MKKELIIFGVFFGIALFGMGLVSASCNLDASMVSQDPYPAIPGEKVKLVFQLDGTSNPKCRDITVEIKEDFPFSLSPGQQAIVGGDGGKVSDFNSYWLIPYELRIHEDALDEEYPIDLRISWGDESGNVNIIEEFDISVDDVKTDFEVSVKNYDSNSKEIVFEILNTGGNDIEALTVEIPRQENIQLQGTNRNIVGSLDSNEDTTFEFSAIPKEGILNLVILYTDQTGERRQIQKDVSYEPEFFENNDDGNGNLVIYIIVVALGIIAFYWWKSKNKKKKQNKSKNELRF